MESISLWLGGAQQPRDDLLAAIELLDPTSKAGRIEADLYLPTSSKARRVLLELSTVPVTGVEVALLVCDVEDTNAGMDVLLAESIPGGVEVFAVFVAPQGAESSPPSVQMDALSRRVSSAGSYFSGSLTLGRSEDGTIKRDSASGIINRAAGVALRPPHAVWSPESQALTLGAQRALRGIFWRLDRDRDGLLVDDEIRTWQEIIRQEKVTDDDIASTLLHVEGLQRRDTEVATDGAVAVPLARDGGITVEGFLTATHVMLYEQKSSVVWAMLEAFGFGRNCEPFSPADISAAESLFQHRLQKAVLSHVGSTFFAGLLEQRVFRTVEEMWGMTPGCPWSDVPGLAAPGLGTSVMTSPRDDQGVAAEDAALGHVQHFVNCWRFMATEHPESVITFARRWGFAGAARMLFTLVPRRSVREEGTPLPSTITVAVVGSAGCGKTSVIRRICPAVSEDDDDPWGGASSPSSAISYVGVTNAFQEGSDLTVAFKEVNATTAARVLQEADFADAVLLLFDGSDPYSFGFMAELVPTLLQHSNLPMALVLTKADMPLAAQRYDPSPETFAAEAGLLWPPVITSAIDAPVAASLSNDIDGLAAAVVELVTFPSLAKAVPQESSMRRILRRTLIVGVAVGAVAAAVRWGLKRKNSK